jgi:serine/threonine protein kinase
MSQTSQLTFINRGSASYVIRVDSNGQNETTFNHDPSFVLKGNLYGKDFDTYKWNKRHMEGLVQEHFTSSPFVTNIYSQCAYSFLAPLSPGGSLYDYIVSMKYFGTPQLSAVDKLKIAIHLASGLAAVHDLKGSVPNATLTSAYAHNDLDTNQYIFHEGVFQLTDFNYGKMNVKRYSDGNVNACFQSPGMHPYLFRSPEDLAYAFAASIQEDEDNSLSGNNVTDRMVAEVVNGKDNAFDYSKSDVFNLGSAIHAMWSLQWMWNNDNCYNNLVQLLKGERPSLNVTAVAAKEGNVDDKTVLKAHTAIAKAIQLCWIHDPLERPTAEHVVTYLKQHLVEILGLGSEKDITLPHLQLDLPRPTKPNNGAKQGDDVDADFKRFLRL